MLTTSKKLLTSILLLTGCGIDAMADTYTIDERHTFPGFEISHLGFSTQRGRFDKTSGTVTLDTDKKTGTVQITIDAKSIDTGLPALEDKLRSAEFFNTDQYPTISYRSDIVEYAGEEPYKVRGELTLLGVTKPLTLTIDHYHCGLHPMYMKTVCGINATGLIKRSEFGMNSFLPMIGDDVKIVIQAEGFRQ